MIDREALMSIGSFDTGTLRIRLKTARTYLSPEEEKRVHGAVWKAAFMIFPKRDWPG